MTDAVPERAEVVVVGAGPTGLTTALALARRGVRPVVLDRLPAPDPVAKAAAIHSGTLQALRPLGANEALIERGRIVDRFAVRSGDRRLALIPFGGLPTPYPYTLVVPQNVTEAVLEDALTAADCPVHRGVRVERVVQRPDAVDVVLSGGRAITADYAVGADGIGSDVRESAGIGFPGGYYADSFVLADVEIDWALPDDEMTLFLSAEGVLVVAPMPGGGQRIVAPVRNASARPARDDVRALIEARGPRSGAVAVSDPRWSARFRVQHRLADRFRAGRVLLAGDAAHVNSPAGGQGMNLGICDGIMLARLLADALRGAGDAALDRYEAERRPIAAEVVAFTGRMTRMLTSRSRAGRILRDAAMGAVGRTPPLQRRLAMNISGIDRAGLRAHT